MVTFPCSSIRHAEFVVACFICLVLSDTTELAGARFDPHFSAVHTLLGLSSLVFCLYLHPLCSVFAGPHCKMCAPSVSSTVCSNKSLMQNHYFAKLATARAWLASTECAPTWISSAKRVHSSYLLLLLIAVTHFIVRVHQKG